MFVLADTDVVSGVLEIDFMDDEAASSTVGQYFDISGFLHRLLVV